MPSIAKMVFGNGPLGPSFAPWIRQYPGVQKYWARWSNLYRHAAGYRQKGYLLDDLVMEESKTVQKALSRLPERVAYDRVWRHRQGIMMSMHHTDLPKSKWTPPEKDEQYLTPYINQVLAEEQERADWDHSVVERIKKRQAGRKNPFERV
ncbi:ubiquinol-cytochrome c reductase subunit 7 [Cryptococcus neoformans]|uniref:Complex III subunit 7 n=2 Tax=Cryptococcus neoformans TaxID=5207 RepID=A0A854QEL1_CRYNE|nr:ubiquinol-cytochrome c reductase subunit 7 [Cryptococcus neoformans var. grubii H99]AUB24536.1 ubiquinol-cytochrome c reductase subunit 7 [Cryptococcus neoformans var. grubii]OWT39804.1 ubiquinol-cytochrome c reductase subunit 7 [Cryptococcus neoformans var. grubii Bt1]OWZ44120.1 ubiquinol-cytochrome c reductase subunit 7 [Cryptococcus neoformans var. grubii C23]OWZ44906.1 ubiquinol-cytochrome c reductase subunit 7 [Cryptococcus neoformans var. grubii AD1-83a]OWZ58356.1 ubiquinol-cytochrome|eukprot:XP_012049471.1 ubiquinol-cytochrome c reductase subunit 7 [Cryptococcus neoformans var. grubii H99]